MPRKPKINIRPQKDSPTPNLKRPVPSNPRKGLDLKIGIGLFIVFLLGLSWWLAKVPHQQTSSTYLPSPSPSDSVSTPPLLQIDNFWDINPDLYYSEEIIVKDDISVYDFLIQSTFSPEDVRYLTTNLHSRGLTQFKKDQDLSLIRSKKSHTPETVLVYTDNQVDYLFIYSLPYPQVFERSKTIETKSFSKTIRIEYSLIAALIKEGIPHKEFVAEMDKALKYSVDFFHLTEGDEFRFIAEGVYSNGELTQTGQLWAIEYHPSDGSLVERAFWIPTDSQPSKGHYVDDLGRKLSRRFLKSPVEYGVISSHYDENRTDPIFKVKKAHRGTDFAARAGTPILALGDGTISKQGFGARNGNFIKIRHDETYSTQYLHMQQFADGMFTGKKVQKGEVIGYVGSTGHSTGPHTCLRFWVNGEQVDFFKHDPSHSTDGLGEMAGSDFLNLRDSLLQVLSNIPREISL